MAVLIVVPARWGSTRLPGKPLADLMGKSLIQRTAEVAADVVKRRPGVAMVVATDDAAVAEHVRSLGHPVAMTDTRIENGTARALAAARAQPVPPDFVVNLQGDSPFTPPATLSAMIDALVGGASVVTPVIRLTWDALDNLRRSKATSPFSGTTCVRNDKGRALWFSKQIIPAIRNEAEERRRSDYSPVLRHIGLYGYALDALEAFCAAPPSMLEQVEGLEQLRFLEAGIPVQTIDGERHAHAMSGIDSPADLDQARALLTRLGEPRWA